MVTVAQLVESRIVIPVVVGSSPISHPNKFMACSNAGHFFVWQFLDRAEAEQDYPAMVYHFEKIGMP